MKERPIIFSGEMVRAILAGKKTVTRRLSERWMKVKKGDGLWVKETFVIENDCEYYGEKEVPKDRPVIKQENACDGCYNLIPHYRATEPEPNIVPPDLEDSWDDRTRWTPSMFMPRKFSRILLEATADAYRERLQNMGYEDCLAEGLSARETFQKIKTGREICAEFGRLWDSLYKQGERWEDNPEVMVIRFRLGGE